MLVWLLLLLLKLNSWARVQFFHSYQLTGMHKYKSEPLHLLPKFNSNNNNRLHSKPITTAKYAHWLTSSSRDHQHWSQTRVKTTHRRRDRTNKGYFSTATCCALILLATRIKPATFLLIRSFIHSFIFPFFLQLVRPSHVEANELSGRSQRLLIQFETAATAAGCGAQKWKHIAGQRQLARQWIKFDTRANNNHNNNNNNALLGQTIA